MPEEEGSMIDRHLQEETDIADLALETEDLVRAPEIEDGRTLDRKIGNSKLHHPRPKVLYLIQTILLVMFQRYIINTRYKQLCKFDKFSLFFMNKIQNCVLLTISINFVVYFVYCFVFHLYRHLHRTQVSRHHLFLHTTRDITIMVITMVRVTTTVINNLLAIEV